jgi:hypothetical protein
MTANISVFAVLRGVTAQGSGNAGYFFLGNGAQPSFFVYTLQPQFGNISGPYSAWVATTGETNWYMPSSDFFLNNPGFIYTDNSSSFVNGSQLTFNPNRASVPNAVSAGAYSIQVGGRVQSDSLAFDFAECIFYNRTITAAQRQQVEGYLAQKWGLTGSLPAGHPGLTSLLFRIQQPFLAKKQYYTAFSPRQIAGCALWLDAADASTITLSGSNVTQWNDKSINGWNVSQATSAKQPTLVSNSLNGLPGLNFIHASSQHLDTANQSSLNSLTGLTLFYVLKPTWNIGDPVQNPAFFGIRAPGGGVTIFNYYFINDYSGTAMFNGAPITSHTGSSVTSAIGKNVVSLYCSTNNNGTDIAYLNGNLTGDTVTSASFGSGTNLPIIIGGDNYDPYENWQGLIYEVVFFTRVLTTTQRHQVESYLAQKWGLVSSLPTTGHLHNTFPAGSPTAIQPYVASVSALNLKFIGYPTGTPTVNTPTNTTTTLNMTWNAPTFTTSWSARQITRVIITSYTVYVLADGSLAATLTPGNVLSTTYSPMTSGVAYSYYVIATGPGGQSAQSATSSTVTYILPPQAPTVNTPTNTVSTLNMTWNAPVGGGQVTSYTVYVLAAGTLVSTLTPGFVTSTTFSPMTGDVAYSFYVSATGPGGTSSVSSTSATVTYSAGPMSYLTGVNFYTGTTAANWTNNWQPYLTAVFSCNAVSNITTTQTRITVSNFVSGNYFLGVSCWDGSIYYAPYNGTSGILRFTPSTGFQGFVGTQVSYTGAAKWYTGVMGADSNIYFFGGGSTSILKYNPATATASLITIAGTGGTFATNSYRGGILGPNGRIYLSPYAATSIFWFDPATVTSGNIATNSSSSLRYEGCSLGPDGKIYMSPFSGVNTMLILDTSTGSVVYPAAGTTTAQTFRGGASLSPNGNLYFPPSVTNGNVLYYNSNTGGNLIANTSALVYRDSHLGPDGKVYITANNGGSNVIVVNPANNTLTNSNNALATNLQGATMGLDGNIYGTAYTVGYFLKIQFNNVAYPFDSNYILSPYANHR